MKEINKICVIGAEDMRGKIGELFSAVGLESIMLNEDYCGEIVDADMVLECSLNSIELRKEASREWDRKAPPNTILATTAAWGITEIAAASQRPERVIGLNFVFNPFDEKYLVQIVKGLDTSDETIKACQVLLEKIGAQAIIVEDSPGFVVDRVLASVINEAVRMYTTGVASIEDIDRISKLCLNWPMGPFELVDTIGIDKILATLEILQQFEGSRFLPCRLLREMVAMKKIGKKTGKGFYTYSLEERDEI